MTNDKLCGEGNISRVGKNNSGLSNSVLGHEASVYAMLHWARSNKFDNNTALLFTLHIHSMALERAYCSEYSEQTDKQEDVQVEQKVSRSAWVSERGIGGWCVGSSTGL